jgi:hypothetical protein
MPYFFKQKQVWINSSWAETAMGLLDVLAMPELDAPKTAILSVQKNMYAYGRISVLNRGQN